MTSACDRLVGRLVGEVAALQPVRVAAQPVVDHLVGEQRVEDEPAGAQAGLERGGHALGGVRALGAVGRSAGARARPRARPARRRPPSSTCERGDLLLEQPAPGVAGGQRLLGEDLLLGLARAGRAGSGARSAGGGGRSRAPRRRAARRRARRRARPTRARRTGAWSRSASPSPARAGRARRARGRRCRSRSAARRRSRRGRRSPAGRRARASPRRGRRRRAPPTWPA